MHGLREIVRSEGVLALWKGLGASLLGTPVTLSHFIDIDVLTLCVSRCVCVCLYLSGGA